jgi:hypothetical protein
MNAKYMVTMTTGGEEPITAEGNIARIIPWDRNLLIATV